MACWVVSSLGSKKESGHTSVLAESVGKYVLYTLVSLRSYGKMGIDVNMTRVYYIP